MDNDKLDFHQWRIELTDREIALIGNIIAQWSALEYEVYSQTLHTYETSNGEEILLPKEMNNLQFTKVLDLWNKRVAQKAEGLRRDVLTKQYHRVQYYKEYRDALVHGMWDWSETDLNNISTIRVRKKEVIKTSFTVNDLSDLYLAVAGINFKIRYSGGLEDFAKSGNYVSRRVLSIFSGSPLVDDWDILRAKSK